MAEPTKAQLLADNEALRNALTRLTEQQTATSEILGLISSSPSDVQPVFDAIARNTVRLCDARFCAVYRFDGELIYLASHNNFSADALAVLRTAVPRRPNELSHIGRAVREREVVNLADVAGTGDAPRGSHRHLARLAGYRGFMAIPMLQKGEPVGCIALGREAAATFPDEQVALVKTFADQAVIAIENARLFTELQDKNGALTEAHGQVTEALEQQTATSEILRVISRSQRDVQPVFDAIAENALRLCNGLACTVFRFDGELIHLAAAHGGAGMDVVRRTFPMPPSRGGAAARAILTGDVVVIPDVLEDREYDIVETARARGYRSMLAVPMLRNGQPIGAINVGRADPGGFPAKQVELIKTFAEQGVIALENVRLFTELQTSNRELTTALDTQTATSDILRVISGSRTDVQPVFDAIVASAVRLLGAHSGALTRIAGDRIELVALTATVEGGDAAMRAAFPQPLDSGNPHAEAIRSRAPLTIADAQTDLGLSEVLRSVARARGYRSIATVPLLRHDEAIGALGVSRREAGGFTDDQIALLQTFADQAVIAIENARLLSELQARTAELTQSVDQLTALGEVGEAVSSSLDLQTVLITIVARATQLAGVDAGVIYEYDEKREVFEPRATHQLEDEVVRSLVATPVRKGEGATGRLAEVPEPVQLADIHAATVFASRARDAFLHAGYRSLLAVPLVREDHLIGGLTVIRKAPGEFGPEIVQLLTTFATQSALAIQNARLFRAIAENSRQLETLSRNMEQLYRLSTAMQEPLSLKEQLGRVLETATRIGLLDRIYVWAVSPEGEKLVNLAGAGFAEDESKQFEGFAIPLVEAGAMYRSLREGRPLVFDDENPLPPALYLKPQYLLKGLRTSRFLIIPMIARGETVGVFAGDNKPSGRPIARETVELLQTFASHAAVAIANARLFQTIEVKSRELEVASQHKSEFLANMSHELRTPLNAIIGFSEVLAEGMFGEVNEKQTEYLRDILESGQHLLSLINDILDLSKIEAGRMELERADFDLPSAIGNALTLVRERAGRRGIILGRTVDGRLGTIRGDERKVKQVLLNLLSNALKFTPEGGRIDVRAAVDENMVEVSVADTGVGIAPEDQEAIFEEFRQVGMADKKVEGTGLGLALCRKFVELHGGRIWVKSQVGIGSTFTFTIPVADPRVSA
jgi:GAF domain-containing protein